MENKIEPIQKKLSWKRFIPAIVIILIGIILIFYKDSTKTTVTAVVTILQNRFRVIIINFLGTVIGILHFYHIGRHNEKIPSDFIRLFSGLFTSIATSIGYAYMMNGSLNFAVGIVNDLVLSKPFFVYKDQIDYVALALVTTLVVFISGYLLWKLAEEFLFEIVQPSIEAEGAPEPRGNNNKM